MAKRRSWTAPSQAGAANSAGGAQQTKQLPHERTFSTMKCTSYWAEGSGSRAALGGSTQQRLRPSADPLRLGPLCNDPIVAPAKSVGSPTNPQETGTPCSCCARMLWNFWGSAGTSSSPKSIGAIPPTVCVRSRARGTSVPAFTQSGASSSAPPPLSLLGGQGEQSAASIRMDASGCPPALLLGSLPALQLLFLLPLASDCLLPPWCPGSCDC